MTKKLSLIILAFAICKLGFAQSSNNEFGKAQFFPGYIITKNIPLSNSKSSISLSDMIIEKGKICVNSLVLGSTFHFIAPDYAEYLVLDKDFVTYYSPAQEDVPGKYVKRELFDQSVSKVRIYTSSPSSWPIGKEVTLEARNNDVYYKFLVCKPVLVKNRNAVYVNDNEDIRYSMYNKTVYELHLFTNNYQESTIYVYDGEELDYDEESGTLCPVLGLIPVVGFVGWLNSSSMVIDRTIYDVKNISIPVSKEENTKVDDSVHEASQIASTDYKPVGDNNLFTVVEQQPEFPGGETALMEFIAHNLRYPEEAAINGIQGRVTVSFVVEKDGSLGDFQIMRSPSEYLSNEALRVLKSMPRWKPGKNKGEPVRVKYVLPVTFRLS